MSRLSFISFCVEHYAEHIKLPSEKVYEIFKQEKVLDFLKEDYGDLHGMGKEYLMQLIDTHLDSFFHKNCPENLCCDRTATTHATVKALLVPEIVRLISQKYKLTEEEALDRFYSSGTAEALSDDETGLYGQSPLLIFSIFCSETDKKLGLNV